MSSSALTSTLCFVQLVWVDNSCGLEFRVAHINPIILALVNTSNFIVLALP